MPTICYVEKNFSAGVKEIIAQAQAIIAEYMADGFTLTLRQLYYQFVARDLLRNTQQNYKRLGSIVSDARNAGLIDWDAIEDRTRNVRRLAHWDSPRDILNACAQQFRYDLWSTQPRRVEVWIEKEALAGVFEPVCQRNDVALFCCRGYTSQSEAWAAGRRLMEYLEAEQEPLILHLGDHDPSGIDMTRDVQERLSLYAESEIEILRLALNYVQVGQYNPPPNPAKMTDSRFGAYSILYGDESWELDALEPRVLAKLVEDEIHSVRDDDLWDEAIERQDAARKRLAKLAEEWNEG